MIRLSPRQLLALGISTTLVLHTQSGSSAIPNSPVAVESSGTAEAKLNQQRLVAKAVAGSKKSRNSLIFDLPLTYNRRVSYWIEYFQTKAKPWFTEWLEKSSRYMPLIQKELRDHNLPQDLAFMVMIESGFEASAKSPANAMGPWQFIPATGERYGLKINWWIDERRDLMKSTRAAIRYLRDLYQEFGSWYLVAASYNMGENGLRRQIQKHMTRDFWKLSQLGALPQETMDYVPKILAAMMISKSPALYDFTYLVRYEAMDYEVIQAPGGTELNQIADQLGVS